MERPEGLQKRIVPGLPDASALTFGMARRNHDDVQGMQMPPTAGEQVDLRGVAAVSAWVRACLSWLRSDIRPCHQSTRRSVSSCGHAVST
jgi:hypothetical protein